jgi:hypothetical protein
LFFLFAGCSFTGSTASIDDGTPVSGDSPPFDAKPTDARMLDAGVIDATMIDAAPIPVRFVQGNSANGGTVSLGTIESGADLNVVGVSWSNIGVSVTSVLDSDGNTYAPIGSPIVLAGNGVLAMYYAPNLHQGASVNTVSVTFSGATGPILVVAEYAGLSVASPLDVTSSGNGTGTSMLASGSVTTTHGHELLVGIAAAGRTVTAGTGFTLRVPANLDLIEDREVMTTGSYDATATLPASGGWTIGLAAFQAAD